VRPGTAEHRSAGGRRPPIDDSSDRSDARLMKMIVASVLTHGVVMLSLLARSAVAAPPPPSAAADQLIDIEVVQPLPKEAEQAEPEPEAVPQAIAPQQEAPAPQAAPDDAEPPSPSPSEPYDDAAAAASEILTGDSDHGDATDTAVSGDGSGPGHGHVSSNGHGNGKAPALEPERRPAAPKAKPRARRTVYKLSEVDVKPRQVASAQPAYPAAAMRRKKAGQVRVAVLIDENGHVAQANLLSVAGHDSFGPAVLGAVKAWRFTPAMMAGRPVKVWATRTLSFRLP
jgi:protein TonB